MNTTKWYLGTMGFSYKAWLGPFYPAGMASRQYLPYYAEHFNALEMDSTFYGTPAVDTVQRWAEITPDDFAICPKTPRAITHDLFLRRATAMTQEFLAAVRLLGDKLGPILLQLPPSFTYTERESLATYLAALPNDRRFAVEFRHRSWDRPDTADLLRAHNICWVAADYIHLPKKIVPTTDFLYIRFLGKHGQFAVKDREQVDRTTDLQQWQQAIEPHLATVNRVYAFFNDDFAGHAPASVNRFKRLLGLELREIRPMQQGRLF